MKNFQNRPLFFAFCTLLSVALSCKDKSPLVPGGNCAGNAGKVSAAATKFADDPSVANCEAYKKEVVAFIKSCPTFYSGVEKEELEEFANSPCE